MYDCVVSVRRGSATVRLVAINILYLELMVWKVAVQDRPVYTVFAVAVCAVSVIGEPATVRLVAINYLYLELMVWRAAVQDRPVYTVSAVTVCAVVCYCTVSCYKLSLPWADGVKGCCARQASIYCLCCNCMWCICCRRCTVRLVAISYLYLELMVWRLLCKTGQYILSLL